MVSCVTVLFVNTGTDRFHSRISSYGCLYIEPWKIDLVSPSGAKGSLFIA